MFWIVPIIKLLTVTNMLRTLRVEVTVLDAKRWRWSLSRSISSKIGTRVHFRPKSVRIIGIEPFYVMHLVVNVITFLWITLAAAERRRVSPRAPAPPPLRPIPLSASLYLYLLAPQWERCHVQADRCGRCDSNKCLMYLYVKNNSGQSRSHRTWAAYLSISIYMTAVIL